VDAVQLAETATIETAARALWDARETNPFADLKPRIDPIVGGSTQRRVLAVLGRRAIEDRALRTHDPVSLKRESFSIPAGIFRFSLRVFGMRPSPRQ
jgi:citrate synthase